MDVMDGRAPDTGYREALDWVARVVIQNTGIL